MTTIPNNWLEFTLDLGWISLMIGSLIILFYATSLVFYKSDSEKYEFVSAHEVKNLERTAIAISISIMFFSFFLISKEIRMIQPYEYYFIGFIAVCIATVIGYALFAFIKYYYPSLMEKRLRHYRFHDRISPITKKPMRLLNAAEEDVHLKTEITDGENNLGKDYDVWFDEESGYTLIEEYNVHEHSLLCNQCNFRTLLDYKEEIEKNPTEKQSGFLKKHYRCSYCGHKEIRNAIIPSFEEERELEQMEDNLQEVIHMHPK